MSQRNVLGGELASCSFDPMTGYYRTGCCESRGDDPGVHVVCVRVTEDFLASAKVRATTSALRCRNTVSPASTTVISGACARHAGRKRSKPAAPLVSSSPPRTCRPSSSATSTLYADTPSTETSDRRHHERRIARDRCRQTIGRRHQLFAEEPRRSHTFGHHRLG